MYNLIRWLGAAIFRIFFRWRVTGLENLPAAGGVIIAANHISNFDPVVVGAAIPRRIHFMAKEELFVNTLLRKIIGFLGAFPVRRGASDRNAIRTAVRLLESGHVVGLFPEGTRSKTGELGQGEPGLAMIAAKAGALIVPAAIIGTNKIFRSRQLLPRFEVRFGTPLTMPENKPSKEELEAVTRTIMERILALQRAES